MQIMREKPESSGFVTDPWLEHSTPGRAARGKHGDHLPGSWRRDLGAIVIFCSPVGRKG